MRIKVGQVFDRLTVVAFVRYGKNSAGFWRCRCICGGESVGWTATGAPDVPGVIALPPLIFLGFLVAAVVLEAVVPLPVLAAQAKPEPTRKSSSFYELPAAPS
jgi:hypothetical protein